MESFERRPASGDRFTTDVMDGRHLDPAETYHEASKLYPSLLHRQMAGVMRLERNPELQRTVLRSGGKRYPHRPAHPLPAPFFPAIPFEAALRQRRSQRFLGLNPVALGALSAVLFAAYGVTCPAEHPSSPDRRTVPSGGALYPMEIYIAAVRVEALAPGLYHYDPTGHRLEELRSLDQRPALGHCFVDPVVADAPVILFLSACFWRSRFKYGLRGYRFVLLEAGHLAQNVQLAATALGLATLPVGGFFDRRVEEFLAIDGLYESVVYVIAVGPGRPAASG